MFREHFVVFSSKCTLLLIHLQSVLQRHVNK